MPPYLGPAAPAATPEPEDTHPITRDALAPIRAEMRTFGLDPHAVKQLQRHLGVRDGGYYNLETARAVYDQDADTGGVADEAFFAARGLFFFKRGETLTPPELRDVAQAHPQGITVSIYAAYGRGVDGASEFVLRAGRHAAEYASVGISGDRAVLGVPIGIETVEEIPTVIHQVTRALESTWRSFLAPLCAAGFGDSNLVKPAFCRVRNLALFSHGMSYGVAMNRSGAYQQGIHDGSQGWLGPSNVEGFVHSVSDALTQDVQVQLFACSTGSEGSGDASWAQPGEGEQDGEESFAAKLNEALEGAGKTSSVLAHTTVGHVTENVSARVFGQLADETLGVDNVSTSLFEILFPEHFVTGEAERLGWERERVRARLWQWFKGTVYGPGGRPRGDRGMQYFTDPEAWADVLQDDWQDEMVV